LIDKTKVYYCLECGKCTGVCPVSKFDGQFSPRQLVEKALISEENEIVEDKEIWSCLTCKLCTKLCPSFVDFLGFITELRKKALRRGNTGISAHGNILQSVREAMTGDINQNRERVFSKGCKVTKKADVLLFVGCQPYFDILFREIGYSGKDMVSNVVQILNKIGITPAVLPNEVCCGHDALWSGNEKAFETLAKKNIDMINNSGAKQIITFCPECTSVLKDEYTKFGMDIEVQHITEFVSNLIEEGKVKFSSMESIVTYHDPCRLGRHLEVYEPPRRILSEIPDLELKEMESNRAQSICCGTTLWTNCDYVSEAIRVSRLKEAQDTGAKTVITACPKCYIHFSCTMSCNPEERDLNPDLKIKDITQLIAETMEVVH
jgi:heterodisulfide reductase subunit D